MSMRNPGRRRSSAPILNAEHQQHHPPTSSTLNTTSSTDFDLWLKLASDNKINAKNSWNFALIDYFHDLSLLREGDGINFRKASATLDGCVKIYSSRVDSAATETGILLSGLSKQQHKIGTKLDGIEEDDEEEEANDDSENESEGGTSSGSHLAKRIVKRDSTLVASFSALRARKVDSELQVDPVFRKALTDFDEGGANSMLLNMLNIDSKGRVIFHSDKKNSKEETETRDQDNEDKDSTGIYENNTTDNDIMALGRRWLSGDLDGLHLCPSMKEIKEISHSFKESNLQQKLTENTENTNTGKGPNDQGSIFYEKNDIYNINDDDEYNDNDNDGFFNEKSINLTIQRLLDESRIHQDHQEDILDHTMVIIDDIPDYDLLAYFDNAMKKHWLKRKPIEHWKVANLKSRRNKETKKYNKGDNFEERKIINFLSSSDDNEEEIFLESNTSTFLPKHQWSNLRDDPEVNLLPHDIQFTSKRLIKHFLKPEKLLRSFNRRKLVKEESPSTNLDNKLADEEFWSQKYQEYDTMNEIEREDLLELNQTYDQSFFEDNIDGKFDNEESKDFNPMGNEFDVGNNKNGYGSQLLFQNNYFKPTYINFARVAKRIDVKLLKDNLWQCLTEDDDSKHQNEHSNEPISDEELEQQDKQTSIDKQFSATVQDLQQKYSKDQMNNLSTSVCFICILHLANEHGLYIASNLDNTDLNIQLQSQLQALQIELPPTTQ